MRLAARRGFTQLEMVVTLMIVSVVLGAVSATVLGVQREFSRRRAVVKTDDTIRSLESLLVRVLRTGRADPKGTGNATIVIDWDSVRVRSDFNPADGDLADDLEDVLVRQIGDTVFVRWKAGLASTAYAYPVSLLLVEAFKLDDTPIVDPAQMAAARKVRLTVKVPRGDRIIVRERWIFLRN